MSGDEFFVLLVSGVLAVVLWARWYVRASVVTPLASRREQRWPALFVPIVCGAVLLWVLLTFAAHDVRDSPVYVVLYFLLGGAWVGLVASLFPLFGLSARDDVVERRNHAAGVALAGALLGTTLCYAGANIGDGPGWWVVVYTAALSTGGLLGAWTLVERTASVSDAVLLDRDVASGLRLGALLAGVGLVLGRAAAGNWEGVGAATADFFAVGWPAAVIALVAAGLHRLLRPTVQVPARSAVTAGLVPALLYLGASVAWVVHAGWWS